MAILDDRKSLLIAFLAISDKYAIFIFRNVSQNGRRRPLWTTRGHFRSHFSPFRINTQFYFIFNFFLQNGRRRPFWITENHVRSHFSPLLKFLVFCFSKMAVSGHFGCPILATSIGTSLYNRSVATSNMKLIGAFLIRLCSAQALFYDFLQIR